VSETGLPPEDFEAALTRIEEAVDSGDTDLLEFWRVVRQIKADPALTERFADAAGRIDRKAFERRVRPRFPVWLGNGALTAGTLVGGAAIAYATQCDTRAVSGALLVGSGAVLSVTVHDLAHWFVGRSVGIRFLCYFLDGPFRIQPGLKNDYACYLRTPPRARAAMHASGAIASKIAPVIPLAVSPLAHAPLWAVLGLAGLTLLQIVTDLTFSLKRSDWKKVRRELAVARDQEARRG
jgi:hypothetical protein